jgi:hypothetical protein
LRVELVELVEEPEAPGAGSPKLPVELPLVLSLALPVASGADPLMLLVLLPGVLCEPLKLLVPVAS